MDTVSVRGLCLRQNSVRCLGLQGSTQGGSRLHAELVRILTAWKNQKQVDVVHSTAPEPMEAVRQEYLRLRRLSQDELQSKGSIPSSGSSPAK